ncbi:MAG: hypothetical protein EBS83_15110 [Planctomycetia bacterium]|nr:hypothetical protein [Planctomycetia bacterium]
MSTATPPAHPAAGPQIRQTQLLIDGQWVPARSGKTFETISRQPLEDLSQWVADDPNQQRGELVLMLGPALTPPAQVLDASVRRILTLLAAELPPRKAAALTAEITGVKARELYEALVAQKQDEQGYT